jgi:hypothetical protein
MSWMCGPCTHVRKWTFPNSKSNIVMLSTTWRARKMSPKKEILLSKSIVLSVLMSSAECWKVTKHELESFQNNCLRRILRIFWPNRVSNEKLLRRIDCEPLSTVIKKRRWWRIGHVCRMPPDALPSVALRWTLEAKAISSQGDVEKNEWEHHTWSYRTGRQQTDTVEALSGAVYIYRQARED